MMAVIVEWQDGTIDSGRSPESVIECIVSSPWNDCSPMQVLGILSDRAWRLGGHAIDPELPPQEFFSELERAGLCRIIEWEPAPAAQGGLGERRPRG